MTRFNIRTRIWILVGIFLVAVAGFFFIRLRSVQVSDEIYSASMEESRLPVVWAESCGREMNCMRGHLSQVSGDVAYDTLTILPEDRRLSLRAVDSDVYVIGARFEVRSSDLTRLIEQTEVETLIKSDDAGIRMILPIQNLLLPEEEYRLDLTLTTQEAGDIHYYTRIRLSDGTDLAVQMLDLATAFSRNNFNFDQAKANTTYVETDGTADDSTLEYTNLKSTFANLAYNNLKLSVVGERDLRFTAYDGNTGEVTVHFVAKRERNNAPTEYYEISEVFSMRMGIVRIYMMNYARTIHQIFTGEDAVTGRRILLGINQESELDALSDAEGTRTFFVVARDLWEYDRSRRIVRNVFSFRNADQDGLMNSYGKHNVRMLRMDENGVLSFLVYGYMNRGGHEGETGIAYMTYHPEDALVREEFFIPVPETYEEIETDMRELSYLGENAMLYLKIGRNVYGVDILNGSYLCIAENLSRGNYTIGKNMKKIAWQDTVGAFGSSCIHIMDLDTGVKQEIRMEGESLLKPEGFIGRDLVISLHDQNNTWIVNGKLNGIPSTLVEIVGDDLEVLKRYEKKGTYIGTVNVHDGRVNMQLLQRTSSGNFVPNGEDTIVSSTEAPERHEWLGSLNSDEKLREYVILLSDDSRPGKLSGGAEYIVNEDPRVISGMVAGNTEWFTAYVDGRLALISDSLSEAIATAYPGMGSVRYHGRTVYSRAATVTSRVLPDYIADADTILEKKEAGELVDISGLPLKPVLYFVGQKHPVLAYADDGRALLIYAYDKTTISTFDVKSGERYYYGIEEADEMFGRGNRDFWCDFTL